ncbi:contact-dependent growth inhibition system immunity protein [Mucilaginibacter sp. L3T2-6]|uniref:contact-dependent growth inhibition system immunity protein n=1 Tax=Mucilaginibacter sp. L3T2-6 TaxID=3062491 RepID=UPI002675C625|nr:contact-dependent growth inhibition system immunity protein [Mucilaginibacter sp. L3T2-6]MDO3642605.1 contact-dependent growth inhibition system immunity protein [Mucilaginibacter sp. L3T2-6]MDV6214999.1 contact-dependent growth inhibition system immunity protein [Mucilaginibacter sp. L3T2-6]
MSKQTDQIKLEHNWRYKTIEQLENDAWPALNGGESRLVKRCYTLRKKVLNDFSVEDLRITIAQGIGLDYLVSLAIEVLSGNLLAEGDLYEGDLLKSVLSLDSEFWVTRKKYWIEIKELIAGKQNELADLKINTANFELI